MGFLRIIFLQSVERIQLATGNGFLWDLFKDFILPISLALGAAWMAYFIFILESNRDKLREENKKNQEKSDKLMFFASLVQGALKVTKQQNENIKTYIKSVRENDIELPPLEMVPLNDLHRISQINLEVYLLAYTNEFKSERKFAINEFKDIIECVDFFDEIYKNIFSMMEKAIVFDYERKLKFQEIFHQSFQLLGNIYYEMARHEAYLPELNKLNIAFQDNRKDNYDITFYNDYFFEPFNQFFVDKFLLEEKPSTNILDFAQLTRDGMQLFKEIKNKNNSVAQDLENDTIRIDKTIGEFETYSKRILLMI